MAKIFLEKAVEELKSVKVVDTSRYWQSWWLFNKAFWGGRNVLLQRPLTSHYFKCWNREDEQNFGLWWRIQTPTPLSPPLPSWWKTLVKVQTIIKLKSKQSSKEFQKKFLFVKIGARLAKMFFYVYIAISQSSQWFKASLEWFSRMKQWSDLYCIKSIWLGTAQN